MTTKPEKDPSGIVWIGAHHDNFRSGRMVGGVLYKPQAVIIHITDGKKIEGTDAWFLMSLADRHKANPYATPSSAHYGISQNGEIHQYVAEVDTAYHAGVVHKPTWTGLGWHPGVNPNAFTIGIEHAGKPIDIWTEDTYTASAALVSAVCLRWTIPIDAEHIVRHSTINALHGQCPGPHCDLERIIREAAAIVTAC